MKHASASSYWAARKARESAIKAQFAAKGEAVPYFMLSNSEQRKMDCRRIANHVCDARCGVVCTFGQW